MFAPPFELVSVSPAKVATPDEMEAVLPAEIPVIGVVVQPESEKSESVIVPEAEDILFEKVSRTSTTGWMTSVVPAVPDPG